MANEEPAGVWCGLSSSLNPGKYVDFHHSCSASDMSNNLDPKVLRKLFSLHIEICLILHGNSTLSNPFLKSQTMYFLVMDSVMLPVKEKGWSGAEGKTNEKMQLDSYEKHIAYVKCNA